MISGGIDFGEPGRLGAGTWPRFAPRLGGGLRNVRNINIGTNFRPGQFTGDLNLPVGYGGLPPILPPSTRLSELVTAPIAAPQAPIPPQIDRRDIPLPPAEIRKGIIRQARDWIEFWQLKNQGIEVLAPPGSSRAQPAPIIAPKPKPTGNKSMDLGSLIKDLGTTYIQSRYAQPQQVPVSFDPYGVTPAVAPAVAGGIGLAAGELYDYFTDPATGGVFGTKKKKCRKRRRRLATVSDIADLAALKSILGNGDAFKTWIATHSR